jgi:hypothetical protein
VISAARSGRMRAALGRREYQGGSVRGRPLRGRPFTFEIDL